MPQEYSQLIQFLDHLHNNVSLFDTSSQKFCSALTLSLFFSVTNVSRANASIVVDDLLPLLSNLILASVGKDTT